MMVLVFFAEVKYFSENILSIAFSDIDGDGDQDVTYNRKC
jgi:hypothetical protein